MSVHASHLTSPPTGQPIPQATSDSLLPRLTAHSLGPHLVPAGSVVEPDFALLLMEHQQQQQQAQCQQGQQQGQQGPLTPYTDGNEPGAEGTTSTSSTSTACHVQQAVVGRGGLWRWEWGTRWGTARDN